MKGIILIFTRNNVILLRSILFFSTAEQHGKASYNIRATTGKGESQGLGNPDGAKNFETWKLTLKVMIINNSCLRVPPLILAGHP